MQKESYLLRFIMLKIVIIGKITTFAPNKCQKVYYYQW